MRDSFLPVVVKVWWPRRIAIPRPGRRSAHSLSVFAIAIGMTEIGDAQNYPRWLTYPAVTNGAAMRISDAVWVNPPAAVAPLGHTRRTPRIDRLTVRTKPIVGANV